MKTNSSSVATVEKFMQTNLIKLKGEVPLTVACRRFFDHKVGSLLIETTDNKHGCLTKTDIINVIGKGEDPGLIRVQDACSKPLLTISKNESLNEAMLSMAKNKLKRIFVVDEKENILGVISSSDILRIAPGLLEIFREESMIQNAEQISSNSIFSGNCDNCKQFSEFLREIGGFALCKDCIALSEESDDDEDNRDNIIDDSDY